MKFIMHLSITVESSCSEVWSIKVCKKKDHNSKNEADIGRRMDRFVKRAPSLVVIAHFDLQRFRASHDSMLPQFWPVNKVAGPYAYSFMPFMPRFSVFLDWVSTDC